MVIINRKHEQHVMAALNAIKQYSTVSKDGGVSYELTAELANARIILNALVFSDRASQSQSTRCIKRATQNYVKTGCSGLDHFKRLVAAEIKESKDDVKGTYEVLRSCFAQLPVRLRNRTLFGAYIRIGDVVCTEGSFSSAQLPKHVVLAINSRKAIGELRRVRSYLPNYREGNVFLAARVRAGDEIAAKEKAGEAIDCYLSLLNLIAGFGGSSWDVNPLQPLGFVVPGVYTTVHDGRGRLIDNRIYYDAELSFVRPIGKHRDSEQVKQFDAFIDVVLKCINQHFDPAMIWGSIKLLGEVYSGTDKSNNFLKCWMVLERLMYFSSSESHEDMLKRIRFILDDSSEPLQRGVLESLRMTRNYVAHQGLDISDSNDIFMKTPLFALKRIVNELFHFHFNLPKAIASKDDFLQFSKLPCDVDALKRKRSLAEAMLARSKKSN